MISLAIFTFGGAAFLRPGSIILIGWSTSGSSVPIDNTMQSMRRAFEVQVMDIASIKSDRDYRRVLKEIQGLMSARRD
jgi:hypothetical protein